MTEKDGLKNYLDKCFGSSMLWEPLSIEQAKENVAKVIHGYMDKISPIKYDVSVEIDPVDRKKYLVNLIPVYPMQIDIEVDTVFNTIRYE